MRPALHHRQDLPSLMILMFLFVQGLVDPLINLVDLILNHKIHLIRHITLDSHQDCLQLLDLLVEREQEQWINRVSDRVRDHHYQILNLFTFQCVLPSGEPQTQPLASQDTDGESEAVEPQSRKSNRSTLLQSKENPQNQKGKKTKKEVVKPNDLPVVKKHKSMDSDEDDEEPQNEPGTSSSSQPFVPVLPLKQGPTSSQGPAASANSDEENSGFCDEYNARSQESGRTLLYPDLTILANDEHWTVTLETHRYAAAAGSFCFVTTET